MTESVTCWVCSPEHDRCPYDCEEQLRTSEQLWEDWKSEQEETKKINKGFINECSD